MQNNNEIDLRTCFPDRRNMIKTTQGGTKYLNAFTCNFFKRTNGLLSELYSFNLE